MMKYSETRKWAQYEKQSKEQRVEYISLYPTRITFSAAKTSIKYRDASAENIIEYGFRGLASLLPVGEWLAGSTHDVNPKAGLSKARTFEPVTCAKGFMTRCHENVEAIKPCNRIMGKPKLLVVSESWGVVTSFDKFGANDSASYIL